MLGKLWKVENTSKIARKKIGKVSFVFGRAKKFMKNEWRGLFRSTIKKTYNSRKEVNEVGL